jgi:hypothetical protein
MVRRVKTSGAFVKEIQESAVSMNTLEPKKESKQWLEKKNTRPQKVTISSTNNWSFFENRSVIYC